MHTKFTIADIAKLVKYIQVHVRICFSFMHASYSVFFRLNQREGALSQILFHSQLALPTLNL